MNHFAYRLTAILILLILISACSSSKHIRLQGNRFDLPETLPSEQMTATVEFAGTTEVHLSPNENFYPADVNAPEFASKPGQAGLRIGYSPQPRWEIQVQTLPNLSRSLNGYPAIKAKYQFRGSDLRSAKKDDFSLAASAGLAYGQDESGTSGNPTYLNEMQLVMIDIGGIGGLRLTDNLLLYGGPFVTPIYFWGEDKIASFNSEQQRDSFSGTAWQWGLNIGAAYFHGQSWSLQTELAYTGIHWKSSSDGFFHAGLQIVRFIE